MDFKIGDVVQLKSGGPLMTLSSHTDKGNWEATWFSKDGKPEWHTFKPEMLKQIHNA